MYYFTYGQKGWLLKREFRKSHEGKRHLLQFFVFIVGFYFISPFQK